MVDGDQLGIGQVPAWSAGGDLTLSIGDQLVKSLPQPLLEENYILD